MATRLNVSLAQLIRQAVDELLRRETEPTAEELTERALSLAGMCRSGVSDLATRHDEHLEGAYSHDGLR